jgi:hypothetical protein
MKFANVAAFALVLAPTPVLATTVLAPGTAGNAQGPAPFRYYGSGGSRVQQVYSSSFFSAPISLTSLSFRAYPGASASVFSGNAFSISNLVVRLSTTSHGDETGNTLSSTFASNVGANVATVYQGALSLATAANGMGPQPFDYTINFQNAFVYDPSMGNLLLDVNVLGSVAGSGFGFLTFDTVNTVNDGIFSVVDINNGAATTGTLSTAGAISLFGGTAVAAVPEPATWAFMVIGFGLVGASARRRRVVSTTAPA